MISSAPLYSPLQSPGHNETRPDDNGEELEDYLEDAPMFNKPNDTAWRPPPGFLLIQIAIFSDVFLSGFDSTITASTWAKIGSEFDAVNMASWLTTSYLITATTFQPLYGRFSDIFGRRTGFFISALTFAMGSLGCGFARGIADFIAMRLLQGVGGAGLMTMATIINSDMIPFQERGMYQAAQNVLWGFGSICGASMGGVIADSIGWRSCFLIQVPVAVAAFVLGYFVVRNPREGPGAPTTDSLRQVWTRVDFSGAVLLILGLSLQLVGLSLGGNELAWTSPGVLFSLLASLILIPAFVAVEAKTTAIPIMPLRMFHELGPVATQLSNFALGAAAFAFLFQLPLFFQVVLNETAAQAGIRLIVPSIGTPVGGVVAGVVMSRWGQLAFLVRLGTGLMVLGNTLVATFSMVNPAWKYIVYLFPANLGQGIAYPGTLFTFMAAFDHANHAVSASTIYLLRSLGGVYGVAITSAITQNTLKSRLPDALSEIPDKRTIIANIRHSVSALADLPPEVQAAARLVYFESIQLSFVASAGFALTAFIAAFFTNGRGLTRVSNRA